MPVDAALEDWLQSAAAHGTGPRVMLAGSAPPDERLHAAVAAAGACVVDEFGEHSIRSLGNPIGTDTEPMAAIAQHYQTLDFGPRSFADKAAQLRSGARRTRADGVVLWLIEEEEALVWEVPAMKDALRDEAIPLLLLTRRRWDAADGALDSIRAFCAALAAS